MLRRFSVFSLAFLLCLSLFPARALADVGSSSVLWSGSINDGAQFGAFVKGGTRFDAAVASLGYDSSRLSDEVKAKLSDPDYGGMFYTFANAFSSVSSPFEIPSWVPAFVTTGSVISDFWNNISGSNYPHWSVAVSQSVYDLALRDFLVVLNGGDLGGGGSGSVVPLGGYLQIPLSACNDTATGSSPDLYYSAQNADYVNGNLIITSGITNYSFRIHNRYYVSHGFLYANQAVLDLANSFINEGYEVLFLKGRAANVYVVVGHDIRVVYGSANNGGSSAYCVFGSDLRFCSLDATPYYNATDGVFCFVPDFDGVPTFVTYNVGSLAAYYSEVFTEPFYSPPSGVWPDSPEPASPVAPELPEPATPTVETPVIPTVPAPVWPDVTINIDNDPTPGTTPSGLDYTELLTRINDNLISIDAFSRAINSNLNSLRGDLLAEFNGVFDSLRNIYNYLLTIDSVLETHCVHLRNKIEESAVFIANYMRTLIKWLADQLDFDDLTNVEAPDNSLLTTINEKLGGGTYEPNPIKDESGYYEWLDDLWDRFLLGDNWQSSMGSISGSFSELKTRFPFSVPWDIVALFRLFVHEPVTPVFDLPLYFSADGSTPVHVDLSPWDSVASLVRPMIFVIFALKLALLSRDLLGGLGADKGGL